MYLLTDFFGRVYREIKFVEFFVMIYILKNKISHFYEILKENVKYLKNTKYLALWNEAKLENNIIKKIWN